MYLMSHGDYMNGQNTWRICVFLLYFDEKVDSCRDV